MNKITISAFVFFTLFSLTLFSQLTVVTDRSDANYVAGESMNFIVSGGFGSATYVIHYDHGVTPAIASGTIQLNGGNTNIPFRIDEPSVVIITVVNNGQIGIASAAFSPFDIQPYEADPSDFDPFWQNQKNQLAAIPINPVIRQILPNVDTRTLDYRINLGQVDGRRVYGYLSIPNRSGTFPAVISHAAFGVGPNICVPRPEIAADIGVISLSIWMHNAEPDQQAAGAYFPKNWDNPSRNYFRYGVLGILRAIDYIETMPEFRGQGIGLNGISEGGGMSILAAGIDDRVTAVSASIHAHSEHSGFKYGRASGFPFYLHESRIVNPTGSTESINQGAKYFDAIRGAKRFDGAFLGAVGYVDQISVPATNFGTYNQLKGSTVIIHKIKGGHQNSDEFYLGKFEFFRNAFGLSGQKGFSANAGFDQTLTNQDAFLSGIIQKNSSNNFSLPVEWEKVSGPGNVGFSNKNNRNTTASFSENGEYLLRLTATDKSILASANTFYTISDHVKITVGGNNAPTDLDNDGFDNSVDCNDFNANIGAPGTACNDFNSNTENDILQSNCTCAGTPILAPCSNNGGDADGDGICANVDCNDFNSSIGAIGDACNDFNSNTENDVIQSNCNCAGTPVSPCANNGGDADGDGICANVDCNDFNSNIGAIGDACNDFNSNTENDVIQSNCNCAGTIPSPPPSSCEVSYSLNGLKLTIEPLNDLINFVKVYDLNFNLLMSCEEWDNTCDDDTQEFTLPNAGGYMLQILTYSDWNTNVCEILERIDAQNTTTTCQNITNGGQIRGDESICPDETPSLIRSRISPSGGNGTVEYLWLSSDQNCPGLLSDSIPGAHESTLTLNQLSQTTYFRRLSRRVGCNDWFLGISNCVLKELRTDCGDAPGNTGTSGCDAEYFLTGTQMNVRNIDQTISTVKIIDQLSGGTIYDCNNFVNPCSVNVSVNMTPGKYFIQIITGEAWGADYLCNIFADFEVPITQNRIGDSADFSTQNDRIDNFAKSKNNQPVVAVYPNPANDFIQISINDLSRQAAKIELLNQLGKVERTGNLSEESGSNILTFSTEKLAAGIYFVKVFQKGKLPIVKKVFIK